MNTPSEDDMKEYIFDRIFGGRVMAMRIRVQASDNDAAWKKARDLQKIDNDIGVDIKLKEIHRVG